MRIRGLVIAAVVLAALTGGLWWSNKKKAAEDAKAPSDTTTKVVQIAQGDVVRIEIARKGADSVTLEKSGVGQWRITAPKEYRADQETVNSFLAALSPLTADKVVDEKAPDLSQYGLKDPALVVTITTKNGKSRKIAAGDDVPTGGGTFVDVDGGPRVFTIATVTKGGLDKSVSDLRDKRLLTFDSGKLTRVELSAKGQNVEFGKNNQNEWQILQPKPLRADGLQVEELIRKLKEAQMDLTASAEDAKKAAAAFASGTMVGTAKVTDANGTQTLQVKKDKAGTYYAKSSVADGVYKATSDLGTGVDKSLDDFRNKKLFDFGFNEPTKVQIQDGAKNYDFNRSGENWMSAGKKLDNVSVQALLDKLRDLQAEKFADSGYGTAAIELTVVSNDGKTTDKVGLSAAGDKYIAKRENEPSLYVIDGKTVKEIEQAASDVKPAVEKKK